MKKMLYLTLIITTTIFAEAVPSYGYVRVCKWDSTVIPLYFYPNSFTSRGYNADEFLHAVINAYTEWITRGDTNLKIYYAGNVNSCDVIDGAIVVCMTDCHADCSTARLASTFAVNSFCDGSKIVFHKKNVYHDPIPWSTNYAGLGSGMYDAQGVVTHELGHAIGFNHSATSNSVMYGSYQIPARTRYLYNDDYDGLYDNEYGYENGSGKVNLRYWNNGTWFLLYSPDMWTNMEPSVSFCDNINKYAVCTTDPLHQVNCVIGDGITWSEEVATNSTTRIGPALAYGNGKLLMVTVQDDDSNDLQYSYSTTCGQTWSNPVDIPNAHSRMHPSVIYDSINEKFVLFYSGSGENKLWSVNAPQGSLTWSTYYTDNTITPIGPAGFCRTDGMCQIQLVGTTMYGHIWARYYYLSGNNYIPLSEDSFPVGDNDAQFKTRVSFGISGQPSTPRVAIGYRATNSWTDFMMSYKDSYYLSSFFHDKAAIESGIDHGVSVTWSPYYNEFAFAYTTNVR